MRTTTRASDLSRRPASASAPITTCRRVFMALEIEPGFLRDASGTIRYHPAFGRV
jgi:predicted N-acetyltransferase YhbS